MTSSKNCALRSVSSLNRFSICTISFTSSMAFSLIDGDWFNAIVPWKYSHTSYIGKMREQMGNKCLLDEILFF